MKKHFIRTVRLNNILSYGPETPEFELQPLNVLIGPNASGKSNLIEALSLLAATPRDILEPIRLGGGTREWLWKGVESTSPATIEVTTKHPQLGRLDIRYRLTFQEYEQRFTLVDEAIETAVPYTGYTEPYPYYSFQNGQPVLDVPMEEIRDQAPPLTQDPSLTFLTQDTQQFLQSPPQRGLQRIEVIPEQSILEQLRNPDAYPELTYLGDRFKGIRFYREWDLSRGGPIRSPQSTDQTQNFLLEDASNLGLVLNDLFTRPLIKQKIMTHIQSFYPHVLDIVSRLRDGTVQLQFHEEGLDHPISSNRLSDGTLRYLCLLTVLCNPEPSSIICLEEPETGLHPDIICEMADLLIEASEHSQIIVTTHSEILVDSLTDIPESIIVCEKPETGTQLRRLNKKELEPWLKEYRLGDLWTTGELGGNRW